MITGIVNPDFDPINQISICGLDGKVYTQDAIVDTGFNGWLSLPPDLFAKRRGRAFLVMEVNASSMSIKYKAVLFWGGNFLTILIDEGDSEPLVSMSVMEGYQLMVQVPEGGHVELSKVHGLIIQMQADG